MTSLFNLQTTFVFNPQIPHVISLKTMCYIVVNSLSHKKLNHTQYIICFLCRKWYSVSTLLHILLFLIQTKIIRNIPSLFSVENGIHMFLWFGLGVNPEFIQKVFGAPSAIQVDIDRVGLPELENPLSAAIRSIIDSIRVQRHRYMRVSIFRGSMSWKIN